MACMNRIRWCAVSALALSFAMSPAAAEIVAIVASTSAVTSLSKAQLTDIFLGKVSRFPNGAQAVPIDQQEGSPARDEFYASYAGKSPAQMKSHWSKIIFTGRGQPPKTVSNNVEVRKLIAADSQAIGSIERSALDSTVKMVIQP